MKQKRSSPKRRKYNQIGIFISCSYLLLSLLLKGIAYRKFIAALDAQSIGYSAIDTRPTPFNTVLWTANIDAGDAYLIGNYSLFDSEEIQFNSYPKNHDLLGGLKTNNKVKRLAKIAEGWYTINKKKDTLYFNDLRFGLISLEPNETRFAFSYKLIEDKDELQVQESEKSGRDAKRLFAALWERMWGN